MHQEKNTRIILVSILIGLVGGVLLGYLIFKEKGSKTQLNNQNTQDLLNMAFPKPNEDLRTVNAQIMKIDGQEIEIETGDPEDYLPHTDGSSQKTITRTGRITSATEMWLIQPSNIDKNGNISRTKISLGDLKTGDTIAVTTSENIRTSEEFDVVLIEKVEY